jgi:hypothetical protein
MKYRLSFAFLCSVLASPFLPAQSPSPSSTPPPALVLIKAAHLLDPVAGVVRENQAILIEGDKVKQVGPAADVAKAAPLEVRVIENPRYPPSILDSLSSLLTPPSQFGRGNSPLYDFYSPLT